MCYAKNDRYFGWKLHLVCDASDIATRFMLPPARLHDTTAVDYLAHTLPNSTVLLGDRGYVREPLRHQLDDRYGVTMIAIHPICSQYAGRIKTAPHAPQEY